MGTQEYMTGDDILLVLCSEEHDPDEYITNYFNFLKIKEKIMSKIKEYAKAYGALISSASDAEQYLGSVPTVVYDGPDQSNFRNVVQHYCKLV